MLVKFPVPDVPILSATWFIKPVCTRKEYYVCLRASQDAQWNELFKDFDLSFYKYNRGRCNSPLSHRALQVQVRIQHDHTVTAGGDETIFMISQLSEPFESISLSKCTDINTSAGTAYTGLSTQNLCQVVRMPLDAKTTMSTNPSAFHVTAASIINTSKRTGDKNCKSFWVHPERSVVEFTGSFANETLLDQHFVLSAPCDQKLRI